MKLLVSDYDDTIEIMNPLGQRYIPKDTISEIEKFRNNGNIFMIATSRPYFSIIKKIKKYNIPYDFLSSLNGSVLHDNNGNILYSKALIEFHIEVIKNMYTYINKIETRENKTLYYKIQINLLKYIKSLIIYLENNDYLNILYIIISLSDKTDSIKYVQKLLDINDEDIITIGDAINDLNMIKNYYSYGVLKFPPDYSIMKYSNKKVKSLKDLFKDINKNI